jgi:glycosyltransferase involved in cell wall biosynthesis
MKILAMSTESSVQMAFVLPLAQYLRKKGHEVVLACSDDPGEAGQSFVDSLRRQGYEVLVLPMRRSISPLWDLAATLKLYSVLTRRRFDVVHTQTAKAGIIGRIAARLARVRVIIYTAHAFPFHEFLPGWRIWLYALAERLAARLCHVIVVDSESVKARGQRYHVAPSDRIRVVPMGIDTEKFDPGKYRDQRTAIRRELGLRPESIVIGASARFVPGKGLDCLLQATARLAQQFPTVACLLVGDGPLRAELERLAAELGLKERVVFAGYRTEVPSLLAAMDLYMLPTHREGFGVAFAEAMSMQVPVVASRISPLTEIIPDGQGGVFADVGSAEAFAKAAVPLLQDDELRHRMGRAGRQHVIARYDQNLMCGAYERIFCEFNDR